MSDQVPTEISVLHVDDDPDFVDVVAEFLEREHDAITVQTATAASDALDVLEERPIDCIVSDYEMPGMDGFDLLEAIRAAYPDLPFILFTGKGSEEIASEAISAGVTEYLQKGGGTDQYTVLANRIERTVGEYRAKEERAESERMFSTLIENLSGMVYRCRNEPGWPMQFVSEGAAALTGYTAAEFESRAVSWGQDIIHPDDRDDTWEAVQQAVARGKSFELTYRIRTRDGDVRWCHERGTGVSENGDLVALEGYITDITEQRRHEQKLEQYRTLVENVGDPMYVLDETGTLVIANQAMADHLGFDREDILGSEPRWFMPDEDAERGVEVLRQLLAEDGTDNWRTWEMDAIHADGTRFRNETKTAIIYDDGEYAGSVGVIRDISDRKKRERELERYETIIEAVGDPVYALDDSGAFTYINDAIERMAGHDPADLVGEPIGAIVVDEDVEAGRRHIRELRDSPDRRATTYEVSVETTDGETIPCELHMALLSAPDGTFRGTAGVLRDIESRKRREQRLERFASVVSHDLRGPLNVVMGRTALARESDDPEHLRTVQSAAERMDNLIEELLTLARRGETVGSLERTRIDELAEEAWELVETEHASLDNGTTLSLEANPDRLRELFENLFRNAVEHGLPDDDTERITVSVGRLDDGGFYVADDGAGFTNGDPEDIFEYGYTTSDDGTGFGLAIVERIADAHGWEITVTDSAGGGARFEFRR